jgi:hypothetical protein
VHRYKDGDKIILTCNEYSQYGSSTRLGMLCYSSTDPKGDRVSEQKGSVLSSSNVNRENFDTLTVGMRRDQVEGRLKTYSGYGGHGERSHSEEFPAALRALPPEDKESWLTAFNASDVDVWSDGAGTRILVAYSLGQAVAFYYIWTGLVDSDRLTAKKGNLGGKGS